VSTVLSETTLLLSAARSLFPRMDGQLPSPGLLRKWAKSGQLDAVKVGTRFVTSQEAVNRFLSKANHLESNPVDALLRLATQTATDPKIRAWASALLERGELASSEDSETKAGNEGP
jgi:hypothetical protein